MLERYNNSADFSGAESAPRNRLNVIPATHMSTVQDLSAKVADKRRRRSLLRVSLLSLALVIAIIGWIQVSGLDDVILILSLVLVLGLLLALAIYTYRSVMTCPNCGQRLQGESNLSDAPVLWIVSPRESLKCPNCGFRFNSQSGVV